jgi:nicotinate-nucleotide adenylyltransferase
MTRVGIFGGTFNPIHYGHLRAAEEVRNKLGLDRILFIPAGTPPLKRADIAGSGHRLEMTEAAVSGNRFFEVSDIEIRLSGKSYTLRTIQTLKSIAAGTEYSLILGVDAFLDLPNWWHPEELLSGTDFIIISRPGVPFSDMRRSPYIDVDKKTLKMLDTAEREICEVDLKSGRKAVLLGITPIGIASTGIRELVRQGRSIKYLLPPKVQSYIIKNKLYVVKS